MKYLEFTNIVKGYIFYKGSQQVFNFELYWSNINPFNLIAGKTRYTVKERTIKKA